MITVQNLLHRLVSHLSRGETLQGHDGGVGAVAEQQRAGLDVTGQRGSMKSRLTECVHGVYLKSEELKLTHTHTHTHIHTPRLHLAEQMGQKYSP